MQWLLASSQLVSVRDSRNAPPPLSLLNFDSSYGPGNWVEKCAQPGILIISRVKHEKDMNFALPNTWSI